MAGREGLHVAEAELADRLPGVGGLAHLGAAADAAEELVAEGAVAGAEREAAVDAREHRAPDQPDPGLLGAVEPLQHGAAATLEGEVVAAEVGRAKADPIAATELQGGAAAEVPGGRAGRRRGRVAGVEVEGVEAVEPAVDLGAAVLAAVADPAGGVVGAAVVVAGELDAAGVDTRPALETCAAIGPSARLVAVGGSEAAGPTLGWVAGHEVHHAPDGIAAVERRRGATDDLDGLEVLELKAAQIEGAVQAADLTHAVDQKEHVLRLEPAQAKALAANGGEDLDRGALLEELGDRLGAGALELLALDPLDAVPGLLHRVVVDHQLVQDGDLVEEGLQLGVELRVSRFVLGGGRSRDEGSEERDCERRPAQEEPAGSGSLRSADKRKVRGRSIRALQRGQQSSTPSGTARASNRWQLHRQSPLGCTSTGGVGLPKVMAA